MVNYTFNDQETIKVFQENLDLIIRENNFPEAYLFAKKLQELLDLPNLNSILSEENLEKYRKMIIIAKFVSLHKCGEEEILELITNHFNIIFDIEFYNILEKIDQFLVINKYFLSERNEFKEKLRKLLLESKVLLTKGEIEINKEKISPTISNWLRDFRDKFTEDGFGDSIKRAEYVSNNKNFISLDKKEKNKVKILIDLYAYLKVSSLDPEGIEEHISVETEDGEPAIMVHGQIEKIPQAVIDIFNEVQRKTGGELYNPHKKTAEATKKVFTPQEEDEQDKGFKKEEKSVEKLLESYKAFEMDLKGIDSIIKGLERYKNDPEKLFLKFNEDLDQNNRDNLLSIIVFLCENKLLDKFLKENQELLSEFKKYLSFKLSDDVIKSIMNKSTSPETVSLYLQFLLFKKVKLSPKNAGLFGMHLANILKKNGQDKYFPMVYGDLNLEQFVWREVIEENGLVKFK